MWSDSHCHLFDSTDDEIDAILSACEASSVTSLLNIGTDLKSSASVLKQCALMSDRINAYAAVGVSAADVAQYSNDKQWESELCTLLGNRHIRALGEIGIDAINDYYAPFEMQLHFFRKQLAIARKFDLPVVVHSRGAEAQALEEVQESGVKGAVFHCYTGDALTASAIASAGYFVSFSGIVTFKRSDFDDVICAVPIDKILIETDSPYLAPVPRRGKKNQPAWVSFVGSYVAGVLGVADERFAELSSRNFHTFLSVQ